VAHTPTYGTTSFVEEYRGWLIGSGVLHVVVALMFSLSGLTIPKQVPQQLAVKATLVDESKIKAAQEAEARQQREERREQQRRKAEQQRLEREKQAKAAAERKAQQQREQQAKVAAERKAQQERERQAQAEADRKAQQQREQQAKADAERKAEQERQRQAEAERQAKADAQRKAAEAAAARKQQELMAAVEAEERLLAARNSGELAQYIALIQQKVERNWVEPAGSQAEIECEVNVSQIPGGEVVSVRIGRCNASPAVVRTIEAAVYKSSPLPLPNNPALFERNLKFVFRPDS